VQYRAFLCSREHQRTILARRHRRSVSAALHDLALKRIIEEHLAEWRTAYDAPRYRGVGSTSRRAKTIHEIYDTAAPLPDAVMPPPWGARAPTDIIEAASIATFSRENANVLHL
jgi:hypothetical protein